MVLMPKQSAVSHDILTAALAGLEAQKSSIDENIAAVRAMLGTAPTRRGRPPKQVESTSQVPARAEASAPRKRGKMSAAARKKIAEAMKKRWAVARKAGKTRLD
jgi:hypothetical protein